MELDRSKIPESFLKALEGGNNGPLPSPSRTLGPHVCRWLEEHAVYGEGDRYGERVELLEFQKAFLFKIFELNEDNHRRFQFAVLSVGKGSGKTPIGSWLALVELLGPSIFSHTDDDGIPVGKRKTSPDIVNIAASWDQANMVLSDLSVNFEDGSPFENKANVTRGFVELLPPMRGSARRLHATARKTDGTKCTLVLVDEAHEFAAERQEGAFNALYAGTSKREDSLTLVISTAGVYMDSLFGRMITHGKSGASGDDELFVCIEADTGLDPTKDEDILTGILQSNPLAASGAINAKRLVTQFKKLPLNQAKRYFWNQWVAGDESWLPDGAWDNCRGPVQFNPTYPTWLGADMALKRDSAAVVMVQKRPDGKLQCSSRVWFPQGSVIDQSEVDDYIRSVCEVYDVQWVAVDEAFWVTLPQLEEEGLPIFRMPQQGKNMVLAYSKLYRSIVDGIVVHDGDPAFADQIGSAAPHTGSYGWTLRKGKNHRRIDSCPALAGALFAIDIDKQAEPVKPRSRIF